jgi:hypothetical protein
MYALRRGRWIGDCDCDSEGNQGNIGVAGRVGRVRRQSDAQAVRWMDSEGAAGFIKKMLRSRYCNMIPGA